MKSKTQARMRRGLRTKIVIHLSKKPKLVVYRSLLHIYVQIVVESGAGNIVLASASTVDKELKPTLSGNKVEQAYQVGKLIGARAKEKDILNIAFDRSGYAYHGRVASLAKGARESGLNF